MRLICMQYGNEVAPVFRDLFPRYERFSPALEYGKDCIFLFSGGTDVDPRRYGETRNPMTQHSDIQRDTLEFDVFNYHKGKVAGFIGICRGSQFLTVANGGKLYQHIGYNHLGNHLIKVRDITAPKEPLILCEVTSTHHQMMNPFNLKEGEDYDLLGWTANEEDRAEYYMGGGMKEYPRPEKEPEIVWYPKTNSLAVQGHPEYLEYDHQFPKLCRRFAAKLFKGD